ncbi:MAG: hypothetical protein OXC18_21300 [Desulfurellaceae bacterium]|nr:hypothetical protein [Desulfurellaceae bacterium]
MSDDPERDKKTDEAIADVKRQLWRTAGEGVGCLGISIATVIFMFAAFIVMGAIGMLMESC